MPQNITINIKNPIEPNLVIKTFSDYHFSFMPSIGENFGHSLLESMLAGTPIITSKNTPWENLETQKIGWDIDLNDIEKFLQTLELCANISQKEYDEFSKNCFNFAKEITKSSEVKKRYLEMFL
jgi:glycosyltransferase involved in cell wall biosynthesis